MTHLRASVSPGSKLQNTLLTIEGEILDIDLTNTTNLNRTVPFCFSIRMNLYHVVSIIDSRILTNTRLVKHITHIRFKLQGSQDMFSRTEINSDPLPVVKYYIWFPDVLGVDYDKLYATVITRVPLKIWICPELQGKGLVIELFVAIFHYAIK